MNDERISPEPTPQSPPSKSSQWLVPLLLFLQLITLVGLGFTFFLLRQQQHVVSSLTSIPQENTVSNEEISIQPILADSEMSGVVLGNWQVYTSRNFDFSIEHPEGWRVVENENYTYFGPQEIQEDTLVGIAYFLSSEKSREEIISEVGEQFEDRQESIQQITLPEGMKAEKLTVTTSQISDWEAITILISTPDGIYTVSSGATKDEMLQGKRGVPEDYTFQRFYESFEIVN